MHPQREGEAADPAQEIKALVSPVRAFLHSIVVEGAKKTEKKACDWGKKPMSNRKSEREGQSPEGYPLSGKNRVRGSQFRDENAYKKVKEKLGRFHLGQRVNC